MMRIPNYNHNHTKMQWRRRCLGTFLATRGGTIRPRPYAPLPLLSYSSLRTNTTTTTTTTTRNAIRTVSTVTRTAVLAATANDSNSKFHNKDNRVHAAAAMMMTTAAALGCGWSLTTTTTSPDQKPSPALVSSSSSSWSSSTFTTAFALSSSLTTITTACEAAAVKRPSSSFQMFMALDTKDEMEKVRLAQIIHDLHDLAAQQRQQQQQQQQQGRQGFWWRRYFDRNNSNNTTDPKQESPEQQQQEHHHHHHPTIGNFISLESVDFSTEQLSHEDAMHLIDALAAGSKLTLASLLQLLQAATNLLAQEENMIDLTTTTTSLNKTNKNQANHNDKNNNKKQNQHDPNDSKNNNDNDNDNDNSVVVVSIVGDLHGSLRSLTHILKHAHLCHKLHTNPNQRLVFDGDFVDRGEHSLEVLLTLLILKLTYPQQVYLLRGNHEDVRVASVYGFQDEIRQKYNTRKPKTTAANNNNNNIQQQPPPQQGNDPADLIWSAMAKLFGALPLALLTDTAFVVHGGLPYEGFELETLRQLPKQMRLDLTTTVKPTTQAEQLVTGLLWSDPADSSSSSRSNGGVPSQEGQRKALTAPNPRGLGIVFDPAVAGSFLQRHNLMHLIRGHQVVAHGVQDVACNSHVVSTDNSGNNKATSVLTVFSAAAYPAGMGSNEGAIVHLNPHTGTYEVERYSFSDVCASSEQSRQEATEQAITQVRSLIGCHKSKLEAAFRQVQSPQGTVSIDHWTEVMSKTIETPGMPWSVLQPRLAPTSFWSPRTINVQDFLQSHSLRVHHSDSIQDHHAAETLAENQEMLLTVFKFLDTNGDGTLSPKEFRTGVDLLNKRLPKDRQVRNINELFHALDEDGNGEISFEEFTHGFGLK
ncbi:hypothetical protein ACA910_012547 [Epithemia clementina (nom. ined.)]